MGKKLILLGMVVAAFAAFAIPAAASASPVLKEGGTALVAPVTINGVSHNAVTTNTALGTLECEEVGITAKVTENSGSSIKANGEAGKTATCFAEGTPLTVTNPELHNLVTTGGDAGTLGLSFTADVGPFECPFAGTGAFGYTTGSDVLNISGIALASTAEICEPEEGSPVFSGDFTITTTNGTAVTVN
jgi:hypothetical protein